MSLFHLPRAVQFVSREGQWCPESLNNHIRLKQKPFTASFNSSCKTKMAKSLKHGTNRHVTLLHICAPTDRPDTRFILVHMSITTCVSETHNASSFRVIRLFKTIHFIHLHPEEEYRLYLRNVGSTLYIQAQHIRGKTCDLKHCKAHVCGSEVWTVSRCVTQDPYAARRETRAAWRLPRWNLQMGSGM
jgi:hypothetical protein